MKETNIFIARHGQTEYNRQKRMQGRGIDAPLNDTGRLQANAIAEYLESRDRNIEHIFCSSLMRARETAEIIAFKLRLEYGIYSELDEMNFGHFEGRAIAEIEDELNELHETWKSGNTNVACEKGESPALVLKRVLSRMDIILEEHKGSDILFVVHGRLIRILLSEWLGYGLRDMHRIDHSNGALYHLTFRGEGNFSPVYLNKTAHLDTISVT